MSLTSRAKSPNSALGICCGPSDSASSGRGCVSTMIPSAPPATAARAGGSTGSPFPAACDGSTITGRCVSCFSTATAPRSSVYRVAVSNVLIPRSQRMIRSFPSFATYSAAIRSSSTEVDMPRFSSTGLSARPTSASSRKFWLFRAPIWITSAASSTGSTWRGSINSVTTGNPVSSPASRRIARPSSPSPWNVYGDVRGLKAPPRSIVAPAPATTRAVSNVCSRYSKEHGPAIRPNHESPIRCPSTSITVGSGATSRATSLYGFRIGSTCSTPGYASSGSDASSSRSPIAPITVASRPRCTRAPTPASCSRARTCSVWSAVAPAPITISSSGEPFAAISPRNVVAILAPRPMRNFSGIPTTGDKHFGNYSGGFRQYAATQEEGDAFFCIVDLHSITVEYDPQELRESTLDLAAMLFAPGLDPARSTVFVQSHVAAHAEAAWLLSSGPSYGQWGRLTKFKDKGERQEFVSAGLFTYPVLMAGDILLYQTDLVPIGDDQRQHLEITRDIAERFNQRFGETFTIPRGVYPEEGARIKNLQEPERLMSTTRGAPQGVVRMIDEPEVIRKKFKTAVTDSGRDVVHNPTEKAGISNL